MITITIKKKEVFIFWKKPYKQTLFPTVNSSHHMTAPTGEGKCCHVLLPWLVKPANHVFPHCHSSDVRGKRLGVNLSPSCSAHTGSNTHDWLASLTSVERVCRLFLRTWPIEGTHVSSLWPDVTAVRLSCERLYKQFVVL